MTFGVYRSVTSTRPDGTELNQSRWFLKNQYIWLRWQDGDAAEIPLEFHGQRIYIAWPPQTKGSYLVLERVD